MPTTWLTVKQLAALLQMHPATVRRHPALRPLAVRLGTGPTAPLRFPPEALDRLKEARDER